MSEPDLKSLVVDALGDCWDTYGAIDFYLMADAVTDLLVDLAGRGELLKAIDRMNRG